MGIDKTTIKFWCGHCGWIYTEDVWWSDTGEPLCPHDPCRIGGIVLKSQYELDEKGKNDEPSRL